MRWIVKVAASAAARNTGSRMFVRFTRMHGLPSTIFAAKCPTMFRSACSGIASADRYLPPLPVAPTVSCPTTISSSAQLWLGKMHDRLSEHERASIDRRQAKSVGRRTEGRGFHSQSALAEFIRNDALATTHLQNRERKNCWHWRRCTAADAQPIDAPSLFICADKDPLVDVSSTVRHFQRLCINGSTLLVNQTSITCSSLRRWAGRTVHRRFCQSQRTLCL